VHLRSGKYWLPIVIYAFSFVRIDVRAKTALTFACHPPAQNICIGSHRNEKR
jgi:hypothetical protein